MKKKKKKFQLQYTLHCFYSSLMLHVNVRAEQKREYQRQSYYV